MKEKEKYYFFKNINIDTTIYRYEYTIFILMIEEIMRKIHN